MPRFIWLQDCSQYLHSSLSVQASTFPFIPLLPLLTLNLGSFARGFFCNLKSLLVSCLLPKSHFLDCFIIVSVYLPTSFPVMNALLLKCVSFLNNLFCLKMQPGYLPVDHLSRGHERFKSFSSHPRAWSCQAMLCSFSLPAHWTCEP